VLIDKPLHITNIGTWVGFGLMFDLSLLSPFPHSHRGGGEHNVLCSRWTQNLALISLDKMALKGAQLSFKERSLRAIIF